MPGAKNLIVVAACSDPENINDAKNVVENLKPNYPVLLDNNAKISRLYKTAAFPTTFVIDAEQNIAFVREGYNPAIAKQIKDKVTSLLADNGSIK